MKPTLLNSGIPLLSISLIALAVRGANSASGQSAGLVRLQSGTPGSQQAGNLHISGTAKVGNFRMVNGAAPGLVLTSDASGVASWRALGGGSGLLLPFVGSATAPSGLPLFSLTNNGTGPAILATNNGSGASIKGVNTSIASSALGVYGVGKTGVLAEGVDIGLDAVGNYGAQGRTSSPSGVGVYGVAQASTGYSYGVLGVNSSDIGFGTAGVCSSTTGASQAGHFQNSSIQGIGVYSLASAGSGTTYGIWGDAYSPDGIGVRGTGPTAVRGDSPNGYGLYGTGYDGAYLVGSVYGLVVGGPRGISATGSDYAISGVSNNPDATGVEGVDVNVLGAGRGVNGRCYANNGYGVLGENPAAHGWSQGGYFLGASPDARALYGLAYASTGITYGTVGQSNSGDAGYGIWGTASSLGYGVFAQGRLAASGTKSFRIDHPLDPANKFLFHYSTEGPEAENFYNGNVTTDSHGVAWVQLPDYFSAINKDFRYTLTVVDDSDSEDFVIAKVARKIRDNRFKIRTNAPNVEVTWRVDALRNDAWVQENGAPVEVEKTLTEKGKYQHPELYGASADLAIAPPPRIPVSKLPEAPKPPH